MLLATQMFLLPMFYGSVIFDHTASAFVWLIFAAVLAGSEINANQKIENRKKPNEIGGLMENGTVSTGRTISRAEDGRRRRSKEAPHSATRNQTLKTQNQNRK